MKAIKLLYVVLIIIASLMCVGCEGPIPAYKYEPLEDNNILIGYDNDDSIKTAIIKTEDYQIESSLSAIEDILILKLSYTNYSKQPVFISLNEFNIKDDKLFIQDRIPVDYLISKYGSKYREVAGQYIPPPKKQIVVEGGTTVNVNKFNDSISGTSKSNYSATEKEEPYSAVVSGISKGIQTSQLKQIESLANKYINLSLPESISVGPETAIIGYIYFQKKTSNYPYYLKMKIGEQPFTFKYSRPISGNTYDEQLNDYFNK